MMERGCYEACWNEVTKERMSQLPGCQLFRIRSSEKITIKWSQFFWTRTFVHEITIPQNDFIFSSTSSENVFNNKLTNVFFRRNSLENIWFTCSWLKILSEKICQTASKDQKTASQEFASLCQFRNRPSTNNQLYQRPCRNLRMGL
jgi:hypothetical protein